MDRLISSSAIRLVGLGLLAVAVVLGPGGGAGLRAGFRLRGASLDSMQEVF